ncbi:MAG: methyltransferase domain-containing protein [Nitriliruptorales bacterium]|nr:methyltransferase domain-containing protein [Nitriliruptorales bacterium]
MDTINPEVTTMRVPTRTATDSERALGTVRSIHLELLRRSGVSFPLRLWDGGRLGDPGLGFELVLNHPGALRAMLLPPTGRAAGEAYVRGHIDVEGDVIAALTVASRVTNALPIRTRLRLARQLIDLPASPERRALARARLPGRRHSPARDRAAIAYHYDLPQAFYEQFLDNGLVYSCAYFADPDESLERAQERKLDLVCRKLGLRPGERLLDIGCGWGSLLLHAAKRYGVRGVGATLSRTQAEAGRQRIKRAGMAGRVEIRLADYRELHEQFDAVASVGMVEHVGPENLGSYFGTVYGLTVDGGRCLVHGIVVNDPRRTRSGHGRDFTNTYVFPDGALFPAWRGVRELESARFELLDVEQLRPHYALTLREWVRRLEANHDAAVAAAGEPSYRVWRAFMAGSAAGFEEGRLGVVQLLGVKGRPEPALPFGRAWMQPVLEEEPGSKEASLS